MAESFQRLTFPSIELFSVVLKSHVDNGVYLFPNRPFPPTFAICRNCQKLRYWVGFVGVLSVNAGERRSPSERSNPAFRVCIN